MPVCGVKSGAGKNNPAARRMGMEQISWTAGINEPHPCLTVEWLLAQFGTSGAESRRRYQKFIDEGVGSPSLWEKVKGQSLLGEESFIEKVRPVLEGLKKNQEIPRTQRYLTRPELEKMFHGIKRGDKRRFGETGLSNKRWKSMDTVRGRLQNIY